MKFKIKTYLSKFLSEKTAAILLAGAMALTVFAIPALAQTLSVDISANPSSGPAPLNDVDIEAKVLGTATGNILYKFDCTADGTWDKEITTSDTVYTAYDLCDYSTAGSYTAKVSVERGGLIFQGTTAIFVQSGSGLQVSLSANPSSGNVPLNDVDLTAQVSGAATGDINYKFDCRNDGGWEREVTSSSTTYTATDLCDYSVPGNYTATVKVERGGLSFQGTTAILAKSGDVSFQVKKTARNISKGETVFTETAQAEPGQFLEFQIVVTSAGQATAANVILKDALPQLMTFKGNLKVDGSVVAGDIVSGLNLGDITSGQSKTVTFEVEVAGADKFTFGETKLINTVTVYNEKSANTGAVTVKVQKSGVAGATAVSTGPLQPFLIALLGAIMIVLLISYYALLKFYVNYHILPSAYKLKSERDLTKTIEKIRKQERT